MHIVITTTTTTVVVVEVVAMCIISCCSFIMNSYTIIMWIYFITLQTRIVKMCSVYGTQYH